MVCYSRDLTITKVVDALCFNSLLLKRPCFLTLFLTVKQSRDEEYPTYSLSVEFKGRSVAHDHSTDLEYHEFLETRSPPEGKPIAIKSECTPEIRIDDL
ncbi:hypothetical protein QVD17_02783 [Tagetes erecta]|uniref:Uncharacterized protein n=1 Tax=Tagetes erecta TaxID=13708 RepID=A0AAD8P948_TARER|nr:hypothetical protein QVD17_02783 [Tagetes erecta]